MMSLLSQVGVDVIQDQFKIIGSFNCKLSIIRLVKNASSLPTSTNVVNYIREKYEDDVDMLDENMHYFMKVIKIDPKIPNPSRNSRILTDARIERDVLLKARRDDKNNFIVKLIAFCDVDETPSATSSLVLELANGNFLETFMQIRHSVCELKHQTNQKTHQQLLIAFTQFLINVLDYLESIGVVYCDWKFENILCFSSSNNEIFKLSDFGSCQTENVEIDHPKNINQVYCSPNFYINNKTITPTHYDDCLSASYLLFKVNGRRLAWEIEFDPPFNLERITTLVNALKIMPETRLKVNHPINKELIYWPEPNSKGGNKLNNFNIMSFPLRKQK